MHTMIKFSFSKHSGELQLEASLLFWFTGFYPEQNAMIVPKITLYFSA